MDINFLKNSLDKGDYTQAIYAAYMDIASLLERVNNHSLEQKNFYEKTLSKMDNLAREVQVEHKDLRKSIYDLELASVKEDHKLNLKIVGWSSFIASICASLASLAAHFIRVAVTH